MSVFKIEMKRIICKTPILLILILVLILRLYYIWGIKSCNMYVDVSIENNKQTYMSCMNRIRGKLTEDNMKLIDEMREEVETYEEQIDKAGEKLTLDRISYDDYWKLVKQNIEPKRMKKRLELLERQLSYVLENTKDRYLLYENGWKQFFGNRTIDVFMIVMLIIFVTYVFSVEYEFDMRELLGICVNGSGRLFTVKTVISVLLAIITGLLCWLEDVLTVHIQYGLEGINFPIHSISMFKDCDWNVTIGQVALLSLILTIIGAIYVTVTGIVIAVILKSKLYTVIVSLAVCVLPTFFITDIKIHEMLMSPAMVLNGVYVLLGYHDIQGKIEVYSFSQICIIFVKISIIILVQVVISYVIYARKNIKIIIKSICVFAITIICLFMGGCSNEQDNVYKTTYNSNNFRSEYITNGTCAVTKYENVCKIIKDGCIEDLFTDALFDEDRIIDVELLNMDQNNIYYSTHNDNNENEIYSINIDTRTSKLIYSDNIFSPIGIDYFNVYEKRKNQKQYYEMRKSSECGWVDGLYYYYLLGDELYQYNYKKYSSKLILKDIYEGDIAYSCGNILYISKLDMNVYIYNIEKEECKQISEDSVMLIKGVTNGFLIQNGKQNINFVKLDGNISDTCAINVTGTICWANDKYVFTIDDTKIYCYDYIKNECKKIIESSCDVAGAYMIDETSTIYINEINDNGELIVKQICQ